MTRLTLARTGIVLAPAGSLAPIAALSRLGLGTRLGSGKAVWPWISLRDEVSALRFLIEHEVRGPVNLAAPDRASSNEITREVARVLHRPYLLKGPAFALRLVLRDAADDLLLSSQHVAPNVLLREGFEFQDLDLGSAIVDALAARPKESFVPQT